MAELPPSRPPRPTLGRNNNGARAWVNKPRPNMVPMLPPRPIWPPCRPHPQAGFPPPLPPPPRRPPPPGGIWFRAPPPPRVPAPSAPTGYGPNGFVELGAYGYGGFQCFRPPLPPPPHPRMPLPLPRAPLLPPPLRHPQLFVPNPPPPPPHGNSGNVGTVAAAAQTTRRGTGVFIPLLPPPAPPSPHLTNNKTMKKTSSASISKNKGGSRNKQGAEFTHHAWKSKNIKEFKGKNGDGAVKKQEGEEECTTPSSEMGLPNEWTY